MRTQFTVGDMTIHRIVEQEHGFTPLFEFLPTLSKERFEENRSWMEQGAYDAKTGNVVLCFQSYVVKTPHHNILVDSCVGNHKPRTARPFWHMLDSDRFERSEGVDVGLILRRIHAPRRESNGDRLAGCPGGLLHACATGQHDQVGE